MSILAWAAIAYVVVMAFTLGVAVCICTAGKREDEAMERELARLKRSEREAA